MSKTARLPIATPALIAINMFVAFWVFLQPELVDKHGFIAAHPTAGGVIAGLFLHQNFLHLAGNMVFLAAVGPAVEYAAGSWRFVAVYFAGGIAGTAAHWLLVSPAAAGVPLIGASGCVAACAAYYTIRYVGLKVPVAPGVGAPVVAITAVWLVLQALGGYFQIGVDHGGTAYWAHLGGFAAGLVLSLTFKAPNLASVQLGHEVLERMNQRGPGATLAMAERHLAQHPGDVHALLQKAGAQSGLGDREGEVDTLITVFELVSEEDMPMVIDRLGDASGLGRLPSIKRTLLAERLKAQHPDAARLLLHSVVDGPDADGQRPEALLALIGLDRESGTAAAWAAELTERYPLHPVTELGRSRGWLP